MVCIISDILFHFLTRELCLLVMKNWQTWPMVVNLLPIFCYCCFCVTSGEFHFNQNRILITFIARANTSYFVTCLIYKQHQNFHFINKPKKLVERGFLGSPRHLPHLWFIPSVHLDVLSCCHILRSRFLLCSRAQLY